MAIESLFTTQSGLTQNTSSSVNAPKSLGSPLNFLDLILGKLQDISTTQNTSSSVTSETQLKKPLLNTDGFSDPSLLSNGKNTDLLISANSNKKPDLLLMQALQINPLQDGNKLAQTLQDLQSKIKAIIANGDNAVITTNLTPEQITAITNAPASTIPDELKNIGTIIVALFDPNQENTALKLSDDPTLANALSVLTPQQPVKKSGASAINNEEVIASKLNTLAPGASDTPEMNFDDLSEFSETFKLSNYIKNAKLTGQDVGQNLTTNLQQNNSPAANSSSIFLGFSAIMTDGALYSSPDSLSLYNDISLSAVAAQPLYSSAPASLTTHAMATTAHPATQAVIMNIQKAANGGQDRIFSMQLEPPELGRVEVRLTFSKNKTLKAHVIAEKPETYMMLQRDADVLQRALSESGLDNESGLSFELSENGFDFNQNNERGGGHDSGGTGGSEDIANENENIQSTITWHVDPLTGYMRYDILV